MNKNTSSDVSSSAFSVIRLALALSIVMLGGISFFLHATEPDFGVDAAMLGGIQYGATALILGGFGGVLWARSWRQNASSAAEERSRTIIGWALGDGAAMMGGIHYLLSGDPMVFLLGCVVGGIALLGISPPDSEEASGRSDASERIR